MMKGKPGRHAPAFTLLILAQKPSYGFEILKALEENLAVNNIDSAAVYRSLKKMEEQELVKSSWDTSQSGAPKKVYTITVDGWQELKEHQEDIVNRYKNLKYFLETYEQLDKKI